MAVAPNGPTYATYKKTLKSCSTGWFWSVFGCKFPTQFKTLENTSKLFGRPGLVGPSPEKPVETRWVGVESRREGVLASWRVFSSGGAAQRRRSRPSPPSSALRRRRRLLSGTPCLLLSLDLNGGSTPSGGTCRAAGAGYKGAYSVDAGVGGGEGRGRRQS